MTWRWFLVSTLMAATGMAFADWCVGSSGNWAHFMIGIADGWCAAWDGYAFERLEAGP